MFPTISVHHALDYSVFASANFDANEYANAILGGELYPPQTGPSKTQKASGLDPQKEDIPVAIAQLNYGIDDVSKQIKSVVCIFVFEML